MELREITKLRVMAYWEQSLPYIVEYAVPFVPLLMCCLYAAYKAYQEACLAKPMWENVTQSASLAALWHILIFPVVLFSVLMLWQDDVRGLENIILNNPTLFSVLNVILSFTVLFVPLALSAYGGHRMGQRNFSQRWKVMRETEAGRAEYRRLMKRQQKKSNGSNPTPED